MVTFKKDYLTEAYPSYKYSPLNPSKTIHTPLYLSRTFTRTRCHSSHHSQNPTQAKYHFTITCPAETLHLAPQPVLGEFHLNKHGITGNLNIPSHLKKPIIPNCPDTTLLENESHTKTINPRKGNYFI